MTLAASKYGPIFAIICLVLILNATGCIGYDSTFNPSWTNKYAHEKRHLRAFWQDMSDIHKFIDRYILDFDENDPARY